jgi:hypothetical protein
MKKLLLTIGSVLVVVFCGGIAMQDRPTPEFFFTASFMVAVADPRGRP